MPSKLTTRLRLTLNQFKGHDPDFLLSGIIVFLAIAEKPGISLKELEKVTGMTKSTVARLARYLSVEHWKKDKDTGKLRPGLDLVVTVSDPMDSRAKVAAPTAKGRWLLETVETLNQTEKSDGSTKEG